MDDVYSYLKKLKFENIYDCEKLFETTDFSGFDINPDPKLDKIFAHSSNLKPMDQWLDFNLQILGVN